jgi:hypothetical protein
VEEAEIYHKWVSKLRQMLDQYQFIMCTPEMKIDFANELFRVSSIIRSQKQSTNLPIRSAEDHLGNACIKAGIF